MSRKKPNIIFILGDDWGWGDLSCYGHENLHTPNLDRLATQGTLFTQFYVSAPVCSPSRAGFMTGQFPSRNGIHIIYFDNPERNESNGVPNHLDPNVPFLTKCLLEGGYRTAHFGKWHLGHWEGAPSPGEYGIEEHLTTLSTGPGWKVSDDCPDIQPQSSEKIVDETIRFIEANKENPFYVNVWLLDPHATLNPTKEQLEAYKHLSPEGVDHVGANAIYHAVISNADKQIGRLLDRLDELGLSEDTIIVFTGDNGPEDIGVRNSSHSGVGSTGPFRGKKRSLYEGGIRLPFIVRWPGRVPENKVDNETVIGGTDFLPTILSIADIPLPEDESFDGEDMSSAWLGKSHQRSMPLMWERRFHVTGHVIHKSPMVAIRDGDWKLLMNPDYSRLELYNIPNDIMEMNNVAGQFPEITKRLSSLLMEWHYALPYGPIIPEAGRDDYDWPGKGKISASTLKAQTSAD